MNSSSLTVPIFPLPDTVLFPHTILPLHIFEPRYKEMISDTLEGERLLGVAQLAPGWDEDYFGSPAIYRTLGVGKIIEAERWPDGRYDIVLAGLYRTHLEQELNSPIYRQARVQIINDFMEQDRSREISDVHELLIQIYDKISEVLPAGYTVLPEIDIRELSPGALTDVLASLLVNDSYERQSLLTEPDIARRQQLLRVQIQTLFNPDISEE